VRSASFLLRSEVMLIEDQLRERLKRVEALYFGATTAGERDAAEAAAERLKAKLEEASRRANKSRSRSSPTTHTSQQ